MFLAEAVIWVVNVSEVSIEKCASAEVKLISGGLLCWRKQIR